MDWINIFYQHSTSWVLATQNHRSIFHGAYRCYVLIFVLSLSFI